MDPNYQINSADRVKLGYLITCILAGMEKATLKAVNYKKNNEITQGNGENLALFLSYLRKK